VYEHALAFNNPFSGRHIPMLLHRAELSDVTIETTALPLSFEAVEFLLTPTLRRGVLTGRIALFEAQHFTATLRAARDYGVFFAHLCMVLASGRKPGAEGQR
jgi:hypothetical protein